MCNWFQNKSPTHTFAVDCETWHCKWAAPCYFNGASPTGSLRWGYCLQWHLACEGLYGTPTGFTQWMWEGEPASYRVVDLSGRWSVQWLYMTYVYTSCAIWFLLSLDVYYAITTLHAVGCHYNAVHIIIWWYDSSDGAIISREQSIKSARLLQMAWRTIMMALVDR